MNGSIRPRTGLLLPEPFQFSKGTTHSPRHIRLTRYCTYLSRPIGKDSWNFRRCQLSELFRTRKRPRMAASTSGTVTLTIGIVKSPAEFVTRPTAHIEKAPTSEPNPLSVPAAVETFALETSWARVKYIELHMPSPRFTATSAAIAPQVVPTNGTMAHPPTRPV